MHREFVVVEVLVVVVVELSRSSSLSSPTGSKSAVRGRGCNGRGWLAFAAIVEVGLELVGRRARGSRASISGRFAVAARGRGVDLAVVPRPRRPPAPRRRTESGSSSSASSAPGSASLFERGSASRAGHPTRRGEVGAERRIRRDSEPLAAGDVAWLAGPVVRPCARGLGRGARGRSVAPARAAARVRPRRSGGGRRPRLGSGSRRAGRSARAGRSGPRARRSAGARGARARPFPFSAARADGGPAAAAPGGSSSRGSSPKSGSSAAVGARLRLDLRSRRSPRARPATASPRPAGGAGRPRPRPRRGSRADGSISGSAAGGRRAPLGSRSGESGLVRYRALAPRAPPGAVGPPGSASAGSGWAAGRGRSARSWPGRRPAAPGLVGRGSRSNAARVGRPTRVPARARQPISRSQSGAGAGDSARSRPGSGLLGLVARRLGRAGVVAARKAGRLRPRATGEPVVGRRPALRRSVAGRLGAVASALGRRSRAVSRSRPRPCRGRVPGPRASRGRSSSRGGRRIANGSSSSAG